MRIKELRKEKNISQSKLAEEINLSNGAIGNYEQGLREPDISTLIALADYFGVSIDYLVEHSPAGSSDNPFTADELELIGEYRKLDAADQARLFKIVKALGRAALEEKKLGIDAG